MNRLRHFAMITVALLLLTAQAPAALQSISLDATASSDSAYYEYSSDAYGTVGWLDADGIRNRFHSPIINPTTTFGGASFDMFPHDAAMKFGSVSYDDAGLVNGSGTVSLSGLSLGILTSPNNSTYYNFARFGNNAETQTTGAFTGTATFAQGVLTSLDFTAPVTIEVFFGPHQFLFDGLFTTSGFNFNFDAAAPTPATLTTFPGPTVASFDFQGTIEAVAVPEPATWTFLGASLALGFWFRQRRSVAATSEVCR